MRAHVFATFALTFALVLPAAAQKNKKPASHDSAATPPAPAVQKIDEAYTAKIREYTTEPFFST